MGRGTEKRTSTTGSPMFSLLITTYNTVLTIRPALESILAQIDENLFETVVVDSCSTDGTSEYLEELEGNGKIRLFSVKCNRGEGRQIALERAKGRYVIARLDMDTVYKEIIVPIAELYLKLRDRLGEEFVLHAGALYVASRDFLLKVGGWKDLQWGENYELNKRLMDMKVLWLCRIEEAKYHIKPSERGLFERLGYAFYVCRDSLRMGLSLSTMMKGINYRVKNLLTKFLRSLFLVLAAYPLHFTKKRYETFKYTDWKTYYVLEPYVDRLNHFEEVFPDKVIHQPSLALARVRNIFVER